MDLPLGQPSGGTMFPGKDIFLSSKLAKNIFLAMDHSHALPTIVTAVSVQLCSLLDSSGRLQESSRKHALLQAAYLPRGKTVIAHHFLTLSVLAILPLPEVLSKSFLYSGRISFSHADSKDRKIARPDPVPTLPCHHPLASSFQLQVSCKLDASCVVGFVLRCEQQIQRPQTFISQQSKQVVRFLFALFRFIQIYLDFLSSETHHVLFCDASLQVSAGMSTHFLRISRNRSQKSSHSERKSSCLLIIFTFFLCSSLLFSYRKNPRTAPQPFHLSLPPGDKLRHGLHANAAHCKKIPGNSRSCSRDLNTI